MNKKYFYRTSLLSWKEIMLTTDDPDIIGLDLHIFKNNSEIYYELKEIKNQDKITYIHINTVEDIDLSSYYQVKTNDEFNDLDVSRAPHFKDFDERYASPNAILGPSYTKEATTFTLWAPLAHKVTLCYYTRHKEHRLEMSRYEKGLYATKLEGDQEGLLYVYEISQNNETFKIIDPYAKSGNLNLEKSAVIDVNKIKNLKGEKHLPEFKKYVDAIIYELHVRDFTIHKNSNIVNKGKYKGLYEENRRTAKGNKAGLDYLVDLGVSHVQLLPVLAAATIDEAHPNKTYNWGYDPYHYFCLEGGYATKANDPYSRLIEFKTLVNKFHEKGLRVNLDVVYNHMYDKETILQRIVPNYYFRLDKDYKFIDQSYCGNAVASEKVMMHKLILESTRYLIDVFDIDGFRFDLMGLTDAKTINAIYEYAHKVKNDIMMYGEGWNMAGDRFNNHVMANMNNANVLPHIAFFNDSYRNIVRGHGSGAELNDNGYLLGNKSYIEGFKFAYCGSSLKYVFPPLFKDINQSLNYVECHDNSTIYDVIENSTTDSYMERLRRIKLLNKTLLLSFGIPFIHAGQEIGLTKFSHHNTYNKGDKYNQFNYDTLDERVDLMESFKNYIAQRKSIPFFHISDPDLLQRSISFTTNNDALVVNLENKEISDTKYIIVINPTKNTIYMNFDEEREDYIYNPSQKRLLTQHAMVFPLSTKIFK